MAVFPKGRNSTAILATMSGFSWFFLLAFDNFWCERTLSDLMIAQFRDPKENEHVQSWKRPLTYVIWSCMAGFPAGLALDVLGRKATMLSFSVPTFLGILLMVIAQNVTTLLTGHLIFAFARGGYIAIMPVLISEISHTSRRRGSLVPFSFAAYSYGLFAAGLSVSYMSLKCQAVFYVLIVTISTGSLLFLPTPPKSSAGKGLVQRTTQSLHNLRANFNAIFKKDILPECLQTDRKGNSTPGSKFAHLKEQIVPQGVAIGIVLMYCQLVAGEGAIFGYTAGVIHSCGLCVKETTFWALLQGINIIVSTVFARKFDILDARLLLSSQLLLTISVVLFALFYSLREWTFMGQGDAYGWIGLFGLLGFNFAFSAVLQPMSLTLLPVLFNQKSRVVMCGMLASWKAGMVLMLMPIFRNADMMWGPKALWINGFTSAIGFIMLWFLTAGTKVIPLGYNQHSLIPEKELKHVPFTI